MREKRQAARNAANTLYNCQRRNDEGAGRGTNSEILFWHPVCKEMSKTIAAAVDRVAALAIRNRVNDRKFASTSGCTDDRGERLFCNSRN